MAHFPVTLKICATCQFWEGVMRGISRDGKHVECKTDARGMCTNARSLRRQQIVYPESRCGEWYRWVAIR